jgi:hypothetical protein
MYYFGMDMSCLCPYNIAFGSTVILRDREGYLYRMRGQRMCVVTRKIIEIDEEE